LQIASLLFNYDELILFMLIQHEICFEIARAC